MKKTILISIVVFAFYNLFSQQVLINELMSLNTNVIQDEDGDYEDWIELYNPTDNNVNLNQYSITDDAENLSKWIFPNIEIESKGFLILFASGKNKTNKNLHTNFKISSKGESIILINDKGYSIDKVEKIELETNQSYGRIKDGARDWAVVIKPTPNKSNNNQLILNQIQFSNESGFYPNAFYLKLSCADSIHYTTDGSIPTSESSLYSDSLLIEAQRSNQISLIPSSFEICSKTKCGEFAYRTPKQNINKAAIIRVCAYKNGNRISKVYSKTFFTKQNHYTIPVISLITDNCNLFNADSGIYVPGNYFDDSDPYWTGNSHQRGIDWERIAYIEFMTDNKVVYANTIGFRVSGQKSRAYPQKSLRFYFRNEYGASNLNYPIFNERRYTEFNRITLRSEFTYWWQRNPLFQDDFIHRVADQFQFDVECQMSSPTILFINGEYWGIHNIRERQDKFYINSLYPDVDKDNVNIMNGNLQADEGNCDDFKDLIEYVKLYGLSEPDHYEYAKQKIDISSYIDYYIIETFFGNIDWPDNNIRFWKTNDDASKWRCLLYDLDASMNDYSSDPFTHINNSDGIQSYLFKQFNANNEFRKSFIERYVFHLNNSFVPYVLDKLINEMQALYEPEVQEHIDRWSNPDDVNAWKSNCRYLQEFIDNRPCYIKHFLETRYNSDDLKKFNCSDSIVENEIIVKVYPNPAVEKFAVIIESEKVISGYLNIYNSQMKKVYSQHLLPNQQVEINHLPPGLYFVQVLIDSKNNVSKLIITQ